MPRGNRREREEVDVTSKVNVAQISMRGQFYQSLIPRKLTCSQSLNRKNMAITCSLALKMRGKNVFVQFLNNL